MLRNYDESDIKKIISIIEKKSRIINSVDSFISEIERIKIGLSYDIYDFLRSDPAAVKAALEQVILSLADAEKAIAQLGGDAGRLLYEFAGAQEARPEGDLGENPWQWLEPGELGIGHSRTQWVVRLMGCCKEWASDAAASIAPPSLGRRTSARVSRRAVERLAKIWRQQTSTEPTISTNRNTSERSGDFVELCNFVILPVWQAHGGHAPNIAEVVRDVLYPRSGKTKE